MPAFNQKKINQIMEQALQEEAFPGAQLLVSHEGQIKLHRAYGLAQKIPFAKTLTLDTLMDISSLTKPVCTVTLLMMAVEARRLQLTDSMSQYIFDANEKITINDLLNHQAGLIACKNYHLAPSPEKNIFADIIGQTYLQPHRHQTIYSDLGFILLGKILENIWQENLSTLFEKKVAKPFGLGQACFNPLKKSCVASLTFAATEFCSWRKRLLVGEVMDGTCAKLGGVSGHAGLFSTAWDIHQWLSELDRAMRGVSNQLSPITAKKFLSAPKNRDPDIQFFHYGFDTPSIPSTSGNFFSLNSLGHLGFTGCSFWWDLAKNTWIILLTNRTHPSRSNEKIKTWRPRIHDEIMTGLGFSVYPLAVSLGRPASA